nr:HisA/HisF-related TIM barrel protein [Actinomycetota bacterium]
MTLARRIVPCLDVRDGRVVKGTRFRDHVEVGDIVDLAERYRAEGADELVFYDITASPQGRRVDVPWVERVARAIDIPFCVA